MTERATRGGGSRSSQPVMVLLELLGRRWALRVLWEAHRRSGQTFRELQASCGDISASVLQSRLAELTEAAVVERADKGYRLSAHGRTLVDELLGLDAWARRWARRGDMPSRF